MNPLLIAIGAAVAVVIGAAVFGVIGRVRRQRFDESWTADEPLRPFIPRLNPLPIATPLTWHKCYTDDQEETWYELRTAADELVGVMQFRPLSVHTALSMVNGRQFRLERHGQRTRLIAIPSGRTRAKQAGGTLSVEGGPSAEWAFTDEEGRFTAEGEEWIHIDTSARQHMFDPTATTTVRPAAPAEALPLVVPLAYFLSTDHYHDED
jgi:hypothetical protein